MKKTYLKSAIATVAILSTATSILAQAGGGAAGGAGAAGGTAGASSVGGVSAGARVSGGTATRGTAPATSAAAAAPRGVNTAGGASILAPSATPPVGSASVIGNPQNTVGGSASGNTIFSSPGTVGAAATLPSGATADQQAIAITSLPLSVQNTLQSVGVNGQVGTIAQVQGVNGPIYRAEITENGVPMELQISQTGQILSRSAVNPTVGPVSTANTLANAQAGLPLSSLPPAVQSSIQGQLGANGQVQTISRDDLANGSVFRVTTTQNGVPTEMRFAANGTLLGTTPLNGTLTSAFTPTAPAAGVLPGTAVVASELPVPVQSAIRSQLGNGRINQMTRLQGTNGMMYAVSYDLNGRPMVMTIGPDGRIISNNPITGVGGAATRATGTGTSTNSSSVRTNGSSRTSLNLDQLPDAVQQTLKREARYAEVRSITREQRVGGDIYVVSLRGDNTVGDLTIGADGKLLSDNRRNFAELSVPKINLDDEQFTGIPLRNVPVAIQDAIKAYAPATDIRSITLGTDRDGKAAYDVIFYRDGRRDRLVVTKDGNVRRVEENVSPALEIPDPNKAPVIAIGDLPPAVQDTIRRQTEGVAVKDITTKKLGSETVYQVHYRANGTPVELLVGMDGKVVLPEGSLDREATGAPIQAPVKHEELASARVVNATENPPPLTSAGAAASSQRGTAKSNATADSINHPAPAKVDISDVPVPVQNAAKKLAGDAAIDSVSPKLSDGGVTYEIVLQQNGARRTVVVNKDGVVVSE